jgi:hypothetical protein
VRCRQGHIRRKLHCSKQLRSTHRPTSTRGVALLRAPAHMDSPAGSNADTYRRRWWRWGRKVLRQRRIVGRRRDIGVDRIGNVGAPAN